MALAQSSQPTLRRDGSLWRKFVSPGFRHRGIPFWALNGKLDRREMIRQFDLFLEMGFGGACLHARTGLATRYLSKQWHTLMRVCVERAADRGALVWLYDEDRYPSGIAGGIVTREKANRQKRLWMQQISPGQEPSRRDALRWFALAPNATSYRALNSPGERGRDEMLLGFHVLEAPCEDWWNGYTYLDTLSASAVARFIESTYEPYRRELGKHFGKAIEAIFTDEPNRGTMLGIWFDDPNGTEAHELPWTPTFPEEFQRRYGYDLHDHLPELYLDIAGKIPSRARYHFHDCLTAVFVDAYSKPLGQWCKKYNVALVGHMQLEETPSAQTFRSGAVMRSLEHFQMPGVDILTADNREYDTVIQCASVARQLGRRDVMSETYGATGWGFTFAQHKAVGDWQLALGVNRRCHHLSYYTMAQAAKRDYPGSIFFQSSWWRHYKHVEDYFARVQSVMTRGQAVREVLVIHPIESTWLRVRIGWREAEDVKQLDHRLETLRDWLLEDHIAFDYGDEEMLSRLGSVTSDTRGVVMKVGRATYRCIVVPPMLTIRGSTIKLIDAFRKKGGCVIWLNNPPIHVDAVRSNEARTVALDCLRRPFQRKSIVNAVKAYSPIRIKGKGAAGVMAHVRVDGSRTYCFICNTDRARATGLLSVQLRASGRVIELDPIQVKCSEIVSRHRRRAICFQRRLPPAGSGLFVIETDSTVRAIPAPQTAEVRRVALPAKRWKYALSESNPLVLDFAQFHLGDGVWSHRDEVLKADTSLRRRIGIVPRSWREIQPWKQPAPKKSFPVWTRWVFNISGAVPDDLELVIERQEGSKQVLINEQNVLLKDAGWWVDPCFRRHLVKGDCLRSGINEIVCRMDYNQRNGLEAMYLLSSRAVAADSRGSTLFPAPQSLRMGDIAQQGLPFYAAGVRYRQTVKVDLHSRERAFVVLRKWAGIGVVVRLDGREVGVIAWPPYEIELPALRGEHELEIEVMLGRQNTFGPLHWRGKRDPWVSPQSFESTGEQWQDDYRIDPGGLLQAPILSIRK